MRQIKNARSKMPDQKCQIKNTSSNAPAQNAGL
jgi:hypothetical protein